ncbi:hypothetical protein ABPG73_012328 [Tetrahymena malaccensis]
MVQKKLLFGIQFYLCFLFSIIETVLSDKIQINPNWFELKEQNALIVSTPQSAQVAVYWQLDTSGYIQKQVTLNGCSCSTNTLDKSFVYQNVLYIFIYNSSIYYTAQFSDIQNALDGSSIQCSQNQGQIKLRQFFYKGYYIITYSSSGQNLIIRKNFNLIQRLSDIQLDNNVIINKKQLQNFSENDSKCITYYDGQSSYIFWKDTEYTISNIQDYKYYLIDENQQLFYDGSVTIYKFQFANYQVSKQIFITLDQGSIFSMLFTIPGYPNQIIVAYVNQQLQLFDTTTLNQLYSISNSQINTSSTSTLYNLILTYQNVLIVGNNQYTLTYQSNTFQSQVSNINNIYQLPCTNILYRRVFFSTKSQILNDSTNDYFITMDDLVCKPGQYMDSKNQCQTCLSNQVFINNQCSVCPPTQVKKQLQDFYISINLLFFVHSNQACVPCPQNCSKCQSTQQCLNCIPGYNLNGYMCQIAYCQTQSPSGQCSQCVSGYTISNGICIQLINNCQTYSTNGQCSVCNSGYTLCNDQCIQSIANCQTYSSTCLCQSCNTGYTVINGSCIQVIVNCQTYSTNGQCSVCNSGYTLCNGQCIQSIANCQTQSSTCLCSQCISGYITNNGNCIQQINNCQKYSTNDQCSVCVSGYTLCNGQCIQSIANCQTYSSTCLCSQCISGYITNNGNCIQQINNCQTYSTNGQCSVCNSGYTLCNGQCIQSITNCQTYSSTCLCQSCNTGYTVINGSCIQGIVNCQTYSTNGQCSVCNSGYTLCNGQCIQSIANCQTYSSTCLCSQCISGYITNNGNCIQQINNCQKYSTNDQCSVCVSGYTLCNGQCIQSIANCQTYSSTCLCQSCNTGYTVINGSCIQVIVNCQTYSTNGQCLVCNSGYTVNNDLCIQSKNNCQTYSSTGQCSQCVSGYTTNNGQCIQQINNCQTYSSNDQCSNCIQGYTLSNGQCIQSIANCQTYSSIGQCQTCVRGYTLNSGNSQKQCVSCDPGKYFDTSSQNCIICIKDMTNNGQCVAQCASNQFYDKVNLQCLNCSAQNQCKPNIPCNSQQYYDQNKTQCISCDKSCLKCQGPLSTDCIQCQSNYLLLQGKCVINCEIGQYYDQSTQSCQLCNGSNQSQCTNCQLGSFYDKGSKTCLKCDVSCKTCEGTGINQCTSCFQDAIFTNLATNQCQMKQSDDFCQNISAYDEDLFNECFQSFKFAQLSSTCLQFLILSSILISSLLICISPVSSPVNWCYLQIQQIIGNYIFSPYINILQINHYHLKYSYMHNILNIIPSFFNQNNSSQFNLNLLNTIINVENFSNSYFSNCFYQILIFLVACFISFIMLIKQKFFSKSIKWLDDYINWNFMIGSIRIISNFIIFTFFLFLSSKTSLSQIDYSFFSTFAIIYSLLYLLLFSKLKSTDQFGQSSNLQLVSLASVGTDEILFLSRIFWIGFEFRKLIVITIQGALLLSNDKFKSVPWIHFSINIFYLILIIKYKPFVKKINNLMLTLMEAFHVFLTFFVSIITSTNNQPYTLEQPFLQNNKNSQILFGYIFIILMILFVITYLLFCFYLIAKLILQNIRKRSQMKQKGNLNISINRSLSISNINKTNSQELIINHLEQKDITWTVNPLKKQLNKYKLQNQNSKQVIEQLQQQQL